MKNETPNHPKTYRLAEILKITRRDAVGLLEMLWQFVAEYAPAGDIGKYPNEAIARAVDWNGNADELLRALIHCGTNGFGFIEKHARVRLIIHDWKDHVPEYVRKRLKRRHLRFVRPDRQAAGNGRQRQPNGSHPADNGCQNLPTQPNPTPPNPTPPGPTKPNTSPPGKTAGAKPRKRDLIWDKICEIFGLDPVTKLEKSRIGKIVSDLKLKKATPEEIRRRADNYKLHWPDAAFTPEALTKHWDTMKKGPKHGTTRQPIDYSDGF
ncbi:MAG: hypothetical protein KAV00_07070 [Phycisphaerae bacterium]|nr:hypothetical protein [Phycisphaerae bacterium]